MTSYRAHSPDYTLMIITGILALVGIFMVASASPVIGETRFGEAYFFLKNQITGMLIGIAAFFICWHIKYTYWKRLAPLILIASLVLMALVFVPGIGIELKGAARWIQVGPFTIQPAEITKLAFIVYVAAWLEAKQKYVRNFSTGFIPFLILLSAVSLFFILQPDIGTLGVLAITAILLFFAGGGKLAQITILCLIGIVSLGFIVFLQPYRLDRITVFLQPDHDTQGIGYQLNQSLIAIGSGGFWGKGFGMSQQKFQYLPEPIGDSIFAVFGEEFGFIGNIGLILLFLLFSWRGIRIANHAPDVFASYLATGITLLIVIQAFTNMAAIIGLVPLTGLPLTFISYGSSALIAHLAAVGILMNVSKYTKA